MGKIQRPITGQWAEGENFGTFSPKRGVYSKYLPLGLRKLFWKRKWKSNARGDRYQAVSSVHSWTDTQLDWKRLWLHAQSLHRFKHDVVPVLRQGKGHGLQLLSKQLSPTGIYLQRKNLVFSNGASLGTLTTLKGNLMLSRRQPRQNNHKGIFWLFFVSYCCVFGSSYLIGLLLVYYGLQLYVLIQISFNLFQDFSKLIKVL